MSESEDYAVALMEGGVRSYVVLQCRRGDEEVDVYGSHLVGASISQAEEAVAVEAGFEDTVDLDPETMRCSFCGLTNKQTRLVVAGPEEGETDPVAICERCARLALEALAEQATLDEQKGSGSSS